MGEGKNEWIKYIVKQRMRCDDNIKVDLKENRMWMKMSQDSVQCLTLVLVGSTANVGERDTSGNNQATHESNEILD
jgi:hypothetical protein